MPRATKTTKATKPVKKAAPKPNVAKAMLGGKVAAKKIVAKKVAPEKVVAEIKEKSHAAEAMRDKPETTTSAHDKAMKEQSELVKKYRGNAKDTGSVSVQIALLTDRINQLAKHLTKHIHDFDSKRGLLILVGKRRRLLNYLRKNNEKVYLKLIKDLKLKK